MGDCLEYWVVSPADAERFQRAGYRVVEESPVGVWSTTGSSVGPFCNRPAPHRQNPGPESNDEHSAPRRDRE